MSQISSLRWHLEVAYHVDQLVGFKTEKIMKNIMIIIFDYEVYFPLLLSKI